MVVSSLENNAHDALTAVPVQPDRGADDGGGQGDSETSLVSVWRVTWLSLL